MLSEVIVRLNGLIRAREAAVLVTDLSSGTQRLVVEGETLGSDLDEAIAAAFRSGKSSKIEAKGRTLFLNAYLPSTRIVVIGAVRISQALAPSPAKAGFRIFAQPNPSLPFICLSPRFSFHGSLSDSA